MILNALLLTVSTMAAPPAAPAASDMIALRVGRAETIADGTIEHAVILVEGSKIVAIGEDLPVARGVRVIDRPDWVAMPGLVSAYTRLGMDSKGVTKATPDQHASAELNPREQAYEDVVRYGVTTLGLYPAGNGIPGLAVAVKPLGADAQEMILADDTYLKVVLRRTKSSKKMLRDGFAKADKYIEKEKKAREKWEADQEKKKKKKKKKKSSKKKDDDKDDDKKKGEEEDDKKKEDKKDDDKKEDADDGGSDVYVPPVPDPDVQVFLDLRAKELSALVSVAGAAEYLHFLDALGDEEIDWSLRLPLSGENDYFYVLDKETYDLDVEGIGDLEARVVVEPRITRHPGTVRQRNLPAELDAAGAKLVFVPVRDNLYNRWLRDVGEVVTKGLDRQTALRALTLEPAEMLGLGDRLGSLEEGKDANIVLLNGDPLEPSTKIEAVMLEGEVVYGEVYP